MKLYLLYLLTTAALLSFTAGARASQVRRWRPPLPVLTKVETKTMLNTADIRLRYRAPRRPNFTWFVSDFPIPENRSDFIIQASYHPTTFEGMASLLANRDKGKQFSVCLQNTVGEVCLRLRPLPSGNMEEDLSFPWPLLVPAPLVRYDEGKTARMHAPELDTPHSYTYSALLLSHDLSDRNRQLLSESSREGGVVTITPAIPRLGGWMVEVATQNSTYEGVLLMSTSFRPQSRLVESCMATRPITVHRKDHTAPFDPGFVAMAPRDSPAWDMSWNCRQGFDCLLVCPFVSNGDVTANLLRMSGSDLQDVGGTGSVWRLGEYYGHARFFVRSDPPTDRMRHSVTYTCELNATLQVVRSPFIRLHFLPQFP